MRTIDVNLVKDSYKVLYADIQNGIQTILRESLEDRKIAIISDTDAANNNMDELEKAIKDGLNSDVATVIDIPIDPEEDVLPFVAPGTGLKDMILPS